MYVYNVGVYNTHADMQCLIPRPDGHGIRFKTETIYLPDSQTTGEPIHDLYTHNHIESEPSMYNV